MQDILIQLQQHVMLPDRIPLALAAIICVSVVGIISGPLAGNANSLFFIVYSVIWGKLGDRLDNVRRSASDLILRGLVLTVFVIVFSTFIGKMADFNGFYFYTLNLSEVLMVAACLSSGSVWFVSSHIKKALRGGRTEKGAYLALSRSARVDLNSTDNFGITRVSLAYLAQSFDKNMVTPVFWYIFGGISMLYIYCGLSFLTWRYGKSGFTKGFGAVPLALEKLMGVVPSLLAGFILSSASALTPTAKLHKSILAWWRVKDRAPYEQGGICLSALAWPLNIVIGGPIVDITGSSLKKEWVGPSKATAQVDFNHIRRALYLNMVAHLLFVFILLCSYVYAMRVF